MSEVNNLISEALKSGLTMDDILADFSKSDNPEEKAWHDKWKATSGAPEYQPGSGMKNQASTIWPENWDRIPDQVPYEIPAAVGAVGLGVLAATKTETGQKIINSLKNRMFGPSTPPDMPGTGLNQAAVAQGALPSSTLASAPQTPMAEAAVVQGPTPEQVRIEKQRAAQAMIEGRPVVAGTGPVTQSVIDNTSPVPETFTPEKVPTADQATKEMVEAGTIKRGKAYGSTDVLDQAALKSQPLIETEKQLEAAGAVKGAAAPPRRTPKEAVVFKEEAPFNKAYNQYSQKLGGMGAPEKSPLQTQFDTAWEDIYKNVFKGEMPKSQGGNPAGWGEAEKLVRSQPEKYSAIIKHLDETAEKYGKSYTSEKGFASLSGMANLAGNALGALGLTQAYKQAKKTGDWSDFGLGAINQVVGNIAPRAAVPLALMTPSAVSSGTLDSPEARELFARAQAKQVGAGRGIAPPSAYMR